MENKRLEYLLNGYLAKTSSPAEENELFSILSSDEYDEQVREYMENAWSRQQNGHAISGEQSERILSSIFAHQDAKIVSINGNTPKKRFIWAAASVAIIAAGLMLFYFLSNPSADKEPVAKTNESHQYKNDVAPGSTGAILKLADGSSIVLDNATDGKLATQGNMQVVKKGGSLNYIEDDGSNDQQISYNTIETPRGRQYQLILEDGTKVWLNAASSIRFPVVFNSSDRRVEITGEVYFEVARDKEKPFRVDANGTTVEVLGTNFNINSYADEETINTTLLEGSVKVSKGDRQKIIIPGQQAQVDGKGEVRTEKNVNVTEVMAWKNNLFSFNNMDIKKLMRQLSRWYDVEVIFKNEMAEPVTFIGGISRTVNLSTVLNILEQTGEVKFDIEGKKIIVKM
jgi:transmembrane sensor